MISLVLCVLSTDRNRLACFAVGSKRNQVVLGVVKKYLGGVQWRHASLSVTLVDRDQHNSKSALFCVQVFYLKNSNFLHKCPVFRQNKT